MGGKLKASRPRGLLALTAMLLGTVSGTATAGSHTDVPIVDGASRPVRSCESLVSVSWNDGARVVRSTTVPGNDVAPSFCLVRILVPDSINVEVGLPAARWDGRYVAIGGGAWSGALGNPAPGVPNPAFVPAVAAGHVVSVTDTGHPTGIATGLWAYSPTGPNYRLIHDFAVRANHEMAVKSKAVAELFYGTAPSYSYWNGCSSGGREGLTEAMLYPGDFNGIYAESPAINWTRFIPAELWPLLVMEWAQNYLPACKADAITKAVFAACNGTADGTASGLFDPRSCSFSPSRLLGMKTACGVITASDVDVIRKIWQGPRDAKGRFLWFGLYPGTSFSKPNELGTTASMPSASDPTGVALTGGASFILPSEWMALFLHKDPSWNYRTETPEQFVKDFNQSVREWAPDFSTDKADLSQFQKQGGKLILYHGLADPLIFPQGTIQYYERMLRLMGPSKVRDFARLFLNPNADHCFPGTGSTYPDGLQAGSPGASYSLGAPFNALVAWVEKGVAPNSLPSTGTTISGKTITRNLCAFPQRIVYKGRGDILKANNFRCAQDNRPGLAGSSAKR